MDHNFFPPGILVWLFIKFLLGKGKQESEIVSGNETITPEPEKAIQYISNGRVLNIPAFYYYVYMLDLENANDISEEKIKIAADNRYALINKIDYEEWPIATRDVKAARAYLLDRWSYMTRLN